MIKLLYKYVKDPSGLTKKLLYALAVLCALLIICLLLLVVFGPRDIFTEPIKEEIPDDLAENAATLDSSLDYGAHYIDSTVFLGDYTTAHLLTFNLLSSDTASRMVWSSENRDIPLDANVKNISIYFEDTDTCKPIAELLSERKPERIIITLGINNGVSYCNEEVFCDYYQSLIDLIKENSPDTIIILQSIFPITKSAAKNNPSISNERIKRANAWISNLAEKNDVHFLYTSSILTDENGYLDSDYAEDDGINLNYTGYKAVLKYVRTHGTYEQ